ncbi:restriction endonuclease subunit S [Paracoccus sp. R86501]|uniref:restriction endonuclease subunit S n=1 Tax=Paracoccus sp. R86501 TaxID=3101711 RepID=UPI00366DCCC4
MKAGWKVRQIEDVAFIQEGPGIRKYEYEEGGFPMINVRCVQDGYIDMSSARAANTELATGKWKHFQVDEGDILFTISGTIGRCAIVQKSDLPLLMNTSVVRFRPTVRELDSRFLYLFLQSEGFQEPLKLLSSGTAIRNVGPTHIKTLSIPLPPLEEQQRIVAVLDEAFEGLARARAHAEANLQNARELFESVLDEAVHSGKPNWRTMTVADTMNCTKVPAKIQRKAYLEKGDFPIVSQEAALINGYWSDADDVIHLQQPVVVFGDHTRALKYVDFDFVVGADGTQIMAPIECFDPRFYYYALKTINLEGKGYARHFSHLKKCEIHFPTSIEEQQGIASQLDEVSVNAHDLEKRYARVLQNLDDLRQSLLQKAFAGELT